MEGPSDEYLTIRPTPLRSAAPAVSFVGWFLLLVVLAAAGAVAARRLRRPSGGPSAPPREPHDDLASLGLSEARPAAARPTPPAPGAPARASSAAVPAPGRAPTVLMPEARAAEPRDIGPRPGGVRLGDDAPWNGRAVPLLLGSLSAHARGHVAVVRRDGPVYAVVARTDGGPLTPVRASALDLDGPRDLDASELGALAALVGGPARAVPLGPLVVLVGGDGGAADGYLDLLASLTPGATAPPAAARTADAVPALVSDDGVGGDGYDDRPGDDGQRDAAPVPRAVVIADEQDAAHAAGRPLAFALVTLADAEDRLTADTPEAVASAEAGLRRRLESAEGVRRVEPFGDLLFGAFLDRDPQGTADWCDSLAGSDPPLFIGAVAPADGEAGEIRDAAAEALRDAYDRRGPSVVSST